MKLFPRFYFHRWGVVVRRRNTHNEEIVYILGWFQPGYPYDQPRRLYAERINESRI